MSSLRRSAKRSGFVWKTLWFCLDVPDSFGPLRLGRRWWGWDCRHPCRSGAQKETCRRRINVEGLKDVDWIGESGVMA